jgi:hypothetical protein
VPPRSRAWVYDRLLAGIACLVPSGRHGCPSFECRVVWCQIKVSATDRSLIQRSPTECGVSERDWETSYSRLRHTSDLYIKVRGSIPLCW